MKLKKSITIILFSLLLSGFAQADFLDGIEAYENKDYVTAFTTFSELATLGNHRAQFNLAVMYMNGEGVPKDLELAYAWSKLAQQDEHTDFAKVAEKILADTDKNQHPILEEKAAQIQAQYGKEAILHKLSPNEYIPNKAQKNKLHAVVSPIKRTAPRYPKEALNDRKQGWVTAMMDIHPDGSVRSVEIIESFPDTVFEKPTVDALSTFKFDVSFPEGVDPYVVQAKQTFIYELPLQASQSKINDLYEKRLTTLKEHASQGHPDAQYVYAVAARSHIVPEQLKIDQKEANHWLLKAAQNGHVEAQYLLGKNILRGKGCQVEKQKAVDWIVYAAEQGHDKSAREVHRLLTEYDNLNHTEKSPHNWLKLSAESGNPESQLEYAQFIADSESPTEETLKIAEQFLASYTDHRKKNVYWYQTAAQIEMIKGDAKLAQKYQKKAKKMAKKLGWDLSVASL
ncbi:SEL1-like repeat protein [Marinicella rhabdoformis]|uniref:SEL1-like repeat protein n=1 Tax=Marinicella rhabdoformis TaxID=2580566 RepID=UPI0012AEB2B9|nr:TonB family protein [Marinicella rhabdoformis]